MTAAAILLVAGWTVQAAEVTGRVSASPGGGAVAGATLTIPELPRAAQAGADGRFRIAQVPAGLYTLVVAAAGFAGASVELSVPPEGATRDFRLTRLPTDGETGEITVTAKRTPRVRDTKVSVTSVTREEIRQAAGAFEDPLKALLFFPGVMSVTDFAGALFVRGGNPNENLTLWDGAVVQNPYHLLLFGGGFNSIFNPDLVGEMHLHKGAFPAEHGDKLSGVIELRSRRSEAERPQGLVSLGLIDSKIFAEGQRGRWNVTAGARRSYYDLAYRLFTGDRNVVLPTFWDVQARVELDLGRHGALQLDLIHFDDDFRFSGQNDHTRSPVSFEWDAPGNVAALIWKRVRQRHLLDTTIVAVNDFRLSGLFSTANPVSLDYHERHWQVGKKIFWMPADNHEATFGFFVFPRKIDFAFRIPVFTVPGAPPTSNREIYSTSVPTYYKLHVFFEDRFLAAEWLTVALGLRGDYHRVLRQGYLDPRLAATVALLPGTLLRFAAGTVHQSPDEGFTPGVRVADLAYANSIHTVVGVEHQAGRSLRLTAEAYYKDLSRLTVPPFTGRTGDSHLNAGALTEGRGFAYGAEAVLRLDPLHGLSGWATYGYGVSRRQDASAFPWYPTESDLTHQASLVSDYAWRTWHFVVRFRYATGRPYTPLEAARYDYLLLGYLPRYGPPNSARLAHYRRLDLRIEKAWRPSFGTLRAYVELLNVENRRNPWNVFYRSDYTERFEVRQIPRLPTFGIEVEL